MKNKIAEILSEDERQALLPEGLIFLGYRGSVAHDMFVPKNDPDSIDDIDLMGIFVGPVEHYLGCGRNDIKEKFIGEWDVVSYELRKFIGLLLKCNPNVLSLLWLPEKHILFENAPGRLLREQKQIFVSKVAYHSFMGYASAQLKRMTHFNQEAQNEMHELEEALRRGDVDPDSLKLTQTQRDQVVSGGLHDGKRLGNVADYYGGLRRRYYAGRYLGAKRKRLVKQVGYDAKNAAHLIRLLRMGIEFLETGDMQIARPDAQELLAIKRGEWPLEKVQTEAERLFLVSKDAYAKSTLPEHPDRDAAEKLCIRIIKECHQR